MDLLVLGLVLRRKPSVASTTHRVRDGRVDDLVPRLFWLPLQCRSFRCLLDKQGLCDARRQILRLLQIMNEELIVVVSMSLVEFDFCVGIRLRICSYLGTHELACLAEHDVIDSCVIDLVRAAVAALRRLAVRWLENLEHTIVALSILQLLFNVHFLTGRLLIGTDTASLMGHRLQVGSLRNLGGLDDGMSRLHSCLLHRTLLPSLVCVLWVTDGVVVDLSLG